MENISILIEDLILTMTKEINFLGTLQFLINYGPQFVEHHLYIRFWLLEMNLVLQGQERHARLSRELRLLFMISPGIILFLAIIHLYIDWIGIIRFLLSKVMISTLEF